MPQAAVLGRRAANSDAVSGLARFGLLARGIIYLLIGWIALQVALGHQTHQANQRGALAQVASGALGKVLIWALAAGFGAYALWRLSEAAFGTAAEGSDKGARAKSGIRGVIYAGLCISAVSFVVGASRQGQSQKQETLTAKIMRHDLGRWAIGLAGLIVVAVGIGLIVEGVRKKFTKQLEMSKMSGRTRTVVTRLGMVGTISRGAVFAVAGILVIAAAATADPHKSTGLDGAVHTLAKEPMGALLLGVLAVGLICFGVFGVANARWAKT